MSTDKKMLSVAANVLQQLPTGSVMVFQALSSSFTNQQGQCQPSNWWLSFLLVLLLTLSCIFFSFTDTFVYQGQVYYGVALPRRFFLLNLSHEEEIKSFTDLHPDVLKDRRLRWDDLVRAFFTAAVFLAFAAGDVGIQNCFFPQASVDAKQLLNNMPLPVAVLSSFVFILCPTRRRSICFLSSWDASTTVPSSSTRIDIESQLHDSRVAQSGHI
ncbi:hypothetical protein PR202_gb12064 [Eleusine coracana subsp. coracana]|uniref:Uncharacterized protein n=1 Tax=Eleusine coracana subsp. coracana TaxID=191504 RepID=A0AAV5ELU5_ELECO|nr:hypothetical protein PR202_gb12064 [Eleusine coracana subsp. coracana]